MRTFFVVLLTLFSLDIKADQPVETKKFYKELSNFYGIENIKSIKIEELSNNNDLFLTLYDEYKVLGIAVLTSAKGRYDKFDFMIVYNQRLEVKLIKMLIYRSDYGSEITAKRWLSQFYNKKEDVLKYGSDIQAISGATFSAISLTKNMNRINKILKDYKEKIYI